MTIPWPVRPVIKRHGFFHGSNRMDAKTFSVRIVRQASPGGTLAADPDGSLFQVAPDPFDTSIFPYADLCARTKLVRSHGSKSPL